MELVRWEQFAGLNQRHSRINDLFSDSFGRAHTARKATAEVWLPAVDIIERADTYLIRAELPGMKKEDVSLEVNDGTLTLSAERKAETLSNGVEYQHSERLHGRFSRSFHLPQTVKQDSIKASYRDGILEIQVPKVEEAQPRQIAISVN